MSNENVEIVVVQKKWYRTSNIVKAVVGTAIVGGAIYYGVKFATAPVATSIEVAEEAVAFFA